MRRKLLSKSSSLLARINSILASLACILLLCMMLSICQEVFMRRFLSRPSVWVIDIAGYSLLWITFLGAAWVLSREGHIKLDVVFNLLNPRSQALINIITSTLGAIMTLAIVWYGAQVTWDHFLRGVTDYRGTEFLKAPILVIIPVGSFLLFLQFLKRIHGYLEMWKKYGEVAAGADEPGLGRQEGETTQGY